jgi:hypothetical protein
MDGPPMTVRCVSRRDGRASEPGSQPTRLTIAATIC